MKTILAVLIFTSIALSQGLDTTIVKSDSVLVSIQAKFESNNDLIKKYQGAIEDLQKQNLYLQGYFESRYTMILENKRKGR